MKTYILYNPLAGRGDNEARARALGETLTGEVELINLLKIGEPVAFFSALGEEDTVILCGGDGTVNRFVNALDGVEVKANILYYAIGTGNDFVHDIGKEAGGEPFDLKPYMCDLPTVEVKGVKRRFINGIGYGIDGYCCEVGDKIKATSTKPVNYTSIAIKGLLFHYEPTDATIIVDGVEHQYKKVWLAATMHGRFYGGGMMATPEQDRLAEEKQVSLLVFHGSGRLKTLMIFPSIFKGEHVNHTKQVAIHTGKDIKVIFDRPTPLQIDGETVLDVTEYRVTANAAVPAHV